MTNTPEFRMIGEEPEAERFRMCRRMLVGPWCNQPEEYEGYNGFVGWAGTTRLRSGRWLLTFTSGYWHGSLPQTEEILKSCLRNNGKNWSVMSEMLNKSKSPEQCKKFFYSARKKHQLDKIVLEYKRVSYCCYFSLDNSSEAGIVTFRNLWFDTNLLEEGRENKRGSSTPSPS